MHAGVMEYGSTAAAVVEIMEAIACETARFRGDLRASMPWSNRDALVKLWKNPVDDPFHAYPYTLFLDQGTTHACDVVVGFSARSAGRLTFTAAGVVLLERDVSPGQFVFAVDDRHAFPRVAVQWHEVTVQFDGPEMPDVVCAHLAYEPRLFLARNNWTFGAYDCINGMVGVRCHAMAGHARDGVPYPNTVGGLPDMRQHVWARVPDMRRAGRGSEAVRALHPDDAARFREAAAALHLIFHPDLALRVLDMYCENECTA